MKRKCKGVDICSLELITEAVYDCLRHYKKRQRADTRCMFARLLGVTHGEARRVLRERGELYHEGVHRVALMLQQGLCERRLKLAPVRQDLRVDPSSKKRRKISILGIRQLLYDHVAVRGMAELARCVGEYQVSSIRGRGAAYGKRAVERWLRRKSCRYATKLDVRDFYGSVNREKLLAWLSRRVKNEPLMWLVGELVCSCPAGMAIGSYLSQTLANIFLSDLYHLAMERCVSKRGGRQVEHALFYMDDMLLLGRNKRQLRYAAFALMRRAGELGLQIKRNWQVHRVSREHPVDMMGYRFCHGMTTLRRRVFKAARRALLRAARMIRRGGRIEVRLARRLASYQGYTASAACKRFLERMGAAFIYKRAFNAISYA